MECLLRIGLRGYIGDIGKSPITGRIGLIGWSAGRRKGPTGPKQRGMRGTGGRGWYRWAGAGRLVQVGRLPRVRADVLAQMDGAGAGGRGWCWLASTNGLVPKGQMGKLTRVCADVCDMRGC